MWVIAVVVVVLFLLWVRRQEPFTSQEIPKTIWTYWDSEDLPDFVSKCIAKWRRLHPDWTIVVLNPKNLKDYLPETDIFKLLTKILLKQNQTLQVLLLVILNLNLMI